MKLIETRQLEKKGESGPFENNERSVVQDLPMQEMPETSIDSDDNQIDSSGKPLADKATSSEDEELSGIEHSGFFSQVTTRKLF